MAELVIESGAKVALTRCKAYDADSQDDVYITGLFEIIDVLPYEPSNYVTEAGVLVDQVDGDSAQTWFIGEHDLIEQAIPKLAGALLEQERMIDRYEEDQTAHEVFGVSLDSPRYWCPLNPARPHLSWGDEADDLNKGHQYLPINDTETQCHLCGAIKARA